MFIYLILSLGFASDVQTVSQLDLNRYQGVWYEIASIPASFQANCDTNTQAKYKILADGSVSVVNSCLESSGQWNSVEARARVNPEFNSPGKLEVTFVKLIDWVWAFAGDYWVLEIGPKYNYVVIGHPDRTFGWILARNQKQSKAIYKKAAKTFAANGYDTCEILIARTDVQNFVERPRLCDYIK